ncbi:hypothetical protein LPJ64_005194 [Coemansia asiatica]|uniref:Uncharacterized protein n=1 Tax=Coemansia asiatica TaxID=1052880 RepID=A0A9W8CH70_9FUNG|nr:hypothetical protein LPJ64_005194 [Coemansia asiatica]
MASANTMWTPEVELALFNSMVGLRPVGIHRHFRMINIYMRFLSLIGGAVEISIEDIKSRLSVLFNIELIEQIEEEDEEDEDADESKNENAVEHRDRDKSKYKARDGVIDANADSESERESISVNPSISADQGRKKEQNVNDKRIFSLRKSNRIRSSHGNQGRHSGGGDEEEPKDEGSSDSENNCSDAEIDKDTRNSPRVGKMLSKNGRSAVSRLVAEIDASDPQFWQKSESEFSLPWSDFGMLMIQRAGADAADDNDELERATGSAASAMSTPKTATPAPAAESQSEAEAEADDEHDATRDAESEAGSKEQADAELSDGPVTPVQRKRKGRSSTPVPRARAKATRSATASARKRQKGR